MNVIEVNGKMVTLSEAREALRVPAGECVGCFLGDDSPETHDFGHGCEHSSYGDAA